MTWQVDEDGALVWPDGNHCILPWDENDGPVPPGYFPATAVAALAALLAPPATPMPVIDPAAPSMQFEVEVDFTNECGHHLAVTQDWFAPPGLVIAAPTGGPPPRLRILVEFLDTCDGPRT